MSLMPMSIVESLLYVFEMIMFLILLIMFPFSLHLARAFQFGTLKQEFDPLSVNSLFKASHVASNSDVALYSP